MVLLSVIACPGTSIKKANASIWTNVIKERVCSILVFRPLNVLFSILVPLKGSIMVPFDN